MTKFTKRSIRVTQMLRGILELIIGLRLFVESIEFVVSSESFLLVFLGVVDGEGGCWRILCDGESQRNIIEMSFVSMPHDWNGRKSERQRTKIIHLIGFINFSVVFAPIYSPQAIRGPPNTLSKWSNLESNLKTSKHQNVISFQFPSQHRNKLIHERRNDLQKANSFAL